MWIKDGDILHCRKYKREKQKVSGITCARRDPNLTMDVREGVRKNTAYKLKMKMRGSRGSRGR